MPRFSSVLSFAPSGKKVATVAFNKDFTRSLYLVTKELLRLQGSFLSAQFDSQEQQLYCLFTNWMQTAVNTEKNRALRSSPCHQNDAIAHRDQCICIS
ncbi:MAG: hypothetical protein ACK4QL_08650 [Pseudanabaenaceae cyanobacterium]